MRNKRSGRWFAALFLDGDQKSSDLPTILGLVMKPGLEARILSIRLASYAYDSKATAYMSWATHSYGWLALPLEDGRVTEHT